MDQRTLSFPTVGMVSKVRHRHTGVEYALKTIQLQKMSSRLVKEMQNEILILKRLDHPNIIREFASYVQNPRIRLKYVCREVLKA